MKQINKVLLGAAAIIVLLTACTTQKKRGEMSRLGEMWHNTNAHYNGYFNADELITESTLQLSEQHQDNYLQLLPLYPYMTTDNPQSVAEQMDEAVKKVTVVINLHPYSQWSDDCYLLAGKALFLKQDYEGAEKAFRFLINEYPPEDPDSGKTTVRGKKRRGNSSTKSRSGNRNEATSAGLQGEKKMTPRQRKKARRQKNKEIARRKKQRERDRRRRKKGRSTSSSRSRTEKPAPEAETTEPTTTPETTPEEASTPAEEEPATGMIRLNDSPTNAFEDDQNYNLKHRPAFQEGQLWLARTLIERNNYNAARRILSQLNESPNTFRDVRREASEAMAHLAIHEKEYALAASAMTQAIELANDKDREARLAFIKAQLHQELGQSGEALAAYEQVVKLRPDYEMEFAARLNIAQNSYLSGQGTAADAIANLERLAKDEKNLPYLGQIYYAMAIIQLAEGLEEEGVALLEQSLSAGNSNKAQQVEAYYRLGMVFFEREDYLAAKTYFDSALSLMSKSDERYLPTERLRNSLVDIARHLQTIELQDSLLAIAELSPEEQAELAKRLYEEKQNNANRGNSGNPDKFGSAGAARVPLRGGSPAGVGGASALRTESDFWAYDDRATKRGQREFNRRWGGRQLEDNWRRSNRNDVSFGTEEEEEVVDINLLTQEQIDKMLADVPKDRGAQESARLEIKKAMYELGRLYRDRLENNQKAVDILEDLNQKYPGHLHELDAWYYLYLAHTDLGNSAKAQEYRDLILNKYPTSTYGQIIQNPNYAQEFLDKERQLDRSYNAVYELFQAGQHEQVLSQSKTNLTQLSGQHPLKPRYALLMAMSTGNTQGKEAYIAELQKVVATYPSTPEETRAKEILRLLGGAGASLPGGAAEESGDFSVSENELHYVIIVFNSDDIDLNAAKIAVSDYNRTYHSLDKLRISNVYLGESNDIPVLVLRRFKDQSAAMAYFDGVQKNSADFLDASSTPFQLLPITQSNYREVLRNRTVEGYPAFFESNY